MNTAELERELNQALQDQKVLEAFEQFYSDDVVMQENFGEPCRGKAANRERTLEWAGTVSQFHSARLIGSAVSGDHAYSEWQYDATYKNGVRYQINQVAVRVWRDGQVVSERFYWDPAKYPYPL
ncbi:MAG TPA: nuclear transport factor 2 family protein [Bryobacteraceae bacterium]|nr:nuclear transport factor 2 family protein [Bryobacteraceae bacterium]